MKLTNSKLRQIIRENLKEVRGTAQYQAAQGVAKPEADQALTQIMSVAEMIRLEVEGAGREPGTEVSPMENEVWKLIEELKDAAERLHALAQ